MEPATHAWHVPERELARHEARRGRRHAFEALDATRTALVVVDMVPFFVEGDPVRLGIVPNITAIGEALRHAGGTVAWVLPAVREPTARSIELYGPDVATTYARSGGDGPLRDRLWRGLDPHDDDLFVEKTSAGAFFPGRCPLPELLAAREVDTVIVTGTVTSVCVESTVRDASTLGYRVVLVGDGCGDVSDEAHNATLRTVYRSFGDVRSTADVLDLIGAPGPAAAQGIGFLRPSSPPPASRTS